MAKNSSPSFVLELPLSASIMDDRIMWSRLEAGRRIYNALLHEGLKRLRLMHNSNAWKDAISIIEPKDRRKAFNELNKFYGFSEYSLHDFVKIVRAKGGWTSRLGSHECQTIATRVYKAVSEYRFKKRGKPRFKGYRRPLHSVEGKTNTACIRFNKSTGVVQWGKITLNVKSIKNEYLEKGLKSPTKYCRILWRNINGHRRWYVQLVQQGTAPVRYDFPLTGCAVGLDVGPSAIAITSESGAGLERFAPSVDQPWRETKRIQRALDRSRRATNPDNYNANGTNKKGARSWVKSSRYLLLQKKLAEIERRLASVRKSEHGQLTNKILGLGNIIKTEKLSYKAFQKLYGRSVKQRAPSMFIEQLNRKAESAGGKLIQLNTWALKMSQFDYTNGLCTKKPLSQRYHLLSDESSVVQRDSYSAFLALNAQGDEHNLSQLEKSWATVEPLLRRVGLCKDQSANGKGSSFPTVAIPSELIARQRVLG